MSNQNHLKNILNEEFNAYVREFKTLLPKLNDNDKRIALAWVNKLKDYNARMVDLKQRNIVIMNLCFGMMTSPLRSPFDKMPKFTNLESVGPFPELDKEKVLPDASKRLPKIMQQSPDQGAFLLTQPLPKCGAFCYLAVVSKPAKD